MNDYMMVSNIIDTVVRVTHQQPWRRRMTGIPLTFPHVSNYHDKNWLCFVPDVS